MVALRGGIRLGTQRELSTYSAGIGLRIGTYRLDYTARTSREGELPQIVSLTFAFPGASRSAVPAAPLPDRETSAVPASVPEDAGPPGGSDMPLPGQDQ
jgi:hypothetical protein